VLEAPVSFFFDGAPATTANSRKSQNAAEISTLITEFFATTEGLAMSRAMIKIRDKELRKRIIALAKQLAGA